MNVLARKIEGAVLLAIRLVVGVLMMAGAVIVLPIAVFSADASLLTNAFVWGFAVVEVLLFGSVGFFGFARPFFLYRRLPEVQAETDGTYLYIHSTKEGKIPLAEISYDSVVAEVPYMMSKAFLVHLLSERYGHVIIKVPGYGRYKLFFISQAQDAVQEIIALAAEKAARRA